MEVMSGDPLVPFYLEPTGPLVWAECFGNDHPVELEVGSGKGLFLITAATRHPERNYCGIEMARKYARLTAERLAKRHLDNARLLRADARIVLRDCIAAASLDAVHIYFPDPWWKRRHQKRRVFTAAFLAQVERVVRPGGALYLATDVAEYFQTMQALVAARPAFDSLPPPLELPPQHDLDYLTNFERKYRQGGRPIFRAQYLLRPGSI
jgi:tRNA (guanine-N7-)-methyltransferase